MLWLLFEAVLAAPKQTVGLGKNTPQTGREAVGFSWLLPMAAALRPQPTEQAQARPGKDPAMGKWVLSAGGRVWGSWSGAHLCVRHDSAHTLSLLLQGVLGKVHERHRTVLCASVSNLEGPERMFGGSWGTAEG